MRISFRLRDPERSGTPVMSFFFFILAEIHRIEIVNQMMGGNVSIMSSPFNFKSSL